MTRIVNLQPAKTHFSRLLQQAPAGREITPGKAGKPYALRWRFTDHARLAATARRPITDATHPIFVSAASAREIAAKQRLGKQDQAPDAAARFTEPAAADGFSHRPVSHLHGLSAGGYDPARRAPFDRMPAAQSELEGLPLTTLDPAIQAFRLPTRW